MTNKLPDIVPGTVFGELTVLYRDTEYEEELRRKGKQRHHFYRCLCACGNEKTVGKANLLRGITQSCGCLQRRKMAEVGRSRTIDLAGRKFGAMVVIGRDNSAPSGSGKHAYWMCECEKCGSQKSVRGNDLTGGHVVDCGCGRAERQSNGTTHNLCGMTFGYLTVLDRDLSEGYGVGGGKHARWNCKCSLCGRIESVSSGVLTRYGKDRCFHCSGMSNGEEKINDILENQGISFKRNRAFGGCKSDEKNWALRFDFIVNDYDGLDTYIIEFDGIQHFKEIKPWESKIDLSGRVSRDNAKNEWCKENNIPLIRIPYTHLKDICLKDLTPSQTKFLI